jgi:erythromycin esterase
MVQLGEPSHAAGTAFAAKARIVKFLHQRNGFDVLIWESGLYDVALAQAAMRDPATSAITAAQKGVFTLWSLAAEVKPLFEYIKASQPTLNPLEMAGFDMQVTADGTTDHFAQDLHSFAEKLRDPDLRGQAATLADQASAARKRLFEGKFSVPTDLAVLATAVGSLRGLIAKRAGTFHAAHGPLKTEFMDHCLENMHTDAVLRSEAAHAQTTPERESRRDAWNAAIVRWLLTRQYAGRKVIIWAHNVHVMDAYYAPGFRNLHLKGQTGDMKTTGVLMKEWLGQKVYTLGMTAYTGEEGYAMGGPRTPISVAPADSLEARLHALGHRFAFLNLRAMGNEKLISNLNIRAPKFDLNKVANPAQVYDGVFFIDQMAAATRV